MLLVLICCLLGGLHTDGDQNQNQNLNQNLNLNLDPNLDQNQNQNQTGNGTLEEHSTFSAWLGFSDVAGVRCFAPEAESEEDAEEEPRIVGGAEAWAHSWPWQASLLLSSAPACGGAIIGPRWVVSAAHCFRRHNKENLWKVLAGKHNLDKAEEPGEQLVGVWRIFSHQDYDSRTKDGDVALLQLQRPLLFNRFVRPIDVWRSALPPGTRCTVTGWGATRENGPRVSRLQEVNVSLLATDVCNQHYGGRVQPSMFCAGKDEGGVDACQGDSGGPLSCFTGTRHELAGLVSWGVGCGRARRPGVYTRLQRHVAWIAAILSDGTRMYDDASTGEEERCGRPRPALGCERPPAPAGLRPLPGGRVRVENVTEACPSSWPWMVSLQSDGRHYCSGVLLHRRWVLTAKHCSVSAKEDVAVLGVHDVGQRSAQRVLVDEVFSPAHDAGFPPRADLALLRLSVSASYGPKASPLCVPEEDEHLDDTWSCVTAGWGRSQATATVDPARLHQAALVLVNRTGCNFLTDDLICSDPAGSASCMGDSGAPLFCRKRDAYFLFGVVTWGGWRCGADTPSVFTAVADYRAWIDDITEQ